MMSGAAVLVGAGLASVRRGQPLPLRPAGSVRVSAGADLVENDEGGAVFLWGMAVSCWDAGGAETRTPLARPQPVDEERRAARRGELAEAAPVICEGAALPMAGALLVLPALAATGQLACVDEVYGKARAAFYGVASLVL